MRTLFIGQKVKLKPSYAKWHLDEAHDMYVVPKTNNWSDCYDTDMMIHLMCCFNIPVYGVVIKQGADNNTWWVEWKVDGLETAYYVNRPHVDVLPIYKLL